MKIDLEILEKFCEGSMSKAEKDAFEKAMQTDEGLSIEVKNYFISKSAIANASNERLKNHLDDMGQDLDLTYYPKTRLLQYMLAAAGICLLIGLGWIMMYYFQRPKTTDEIFLSYYQRPDISEFTERSLGGDSSLLIWNTALDNYSKHEILKASGEFEQLTNNQSAIPFSKVFYLLAICYMESNEFEKAIQAFDHVGAESSFVYAMQYYKALCFIKMDKRQEAIDMLNTIKQQPGHPYGKQAKRLLRILIKR
jgi:tetratricopeptide (TPR) repeat protein